MAFVSPLLLASTGEMRQAAPWKGKKEAMSVGFLHGLLGLEPGRWAEAQTQRIRALQQSWAQG